MALLIGMCLIVGLVLILSIAQVVGGGGGSNTINVPINVTASGDTAIAAAQGHGRAVRVHQITLNASGGANTITLKSGANILFGPKDMANDGDFISPDSPDGLWNTGYNEALNLNLTAATAVTGSMKISIIDANLMAIGMQR